MYTHCVHDVLSLCILYTYCICNVLSLCIVYKYTSMTLSKNHLKKIKQAYSSSVTTVYCSKSKALVPIVCLSSICPQSIPCPQLLNHLSISPAIQIQVHCFLPPLALSLCPLIPWELTFPLFFKQHNGHRASLEALHSLLSMDPGTRSILTHLGPSLTMHLSMHT